ncbi:hypothetical protein AWH56_020805 [Anaerobacillus isosaccharinicus]|uniref:Uncharacterized protein n=1 Tax=Anaerobacillus isosaccharinicus TaxID=1532552 RepID=A0A1S2M324_9BACI|nr:hypothetical protein [Anaerobacillus isosaccharinicus]MBA5586652.1 hypothetical protein [Anaerobacillus isosaccharinicus]QOY35115.1 hypothetical protein AWH56_020805 [Anaerobacillus isosaccharinicus]
MLLFSITLFIIGCSETDSKQLTYENDLVVEKQIDDKNQYEVYTKITNTEKMVEIKSLLNNISWEAKEVLMLQPPHYKLRFIDKHSGNDLQSYFIWITPDKETIEVVKEAWGYRKLSKNQAKKLLDLTIGEALLK